MIFSPALCDLILVGKKRVTRRPVKWRETPADVEIIPCRYKVNKTYAVQPGRGKSGVGRVRIVSTELQSLGYLSGPEAALEGFQMWDGRGVPNAFENRWRELYGGYNPMRSVWRIEFELVA